jgi:hypothetical protein
MTVMLLALFFSDAAMNATDVSEHRFVANEEVGGPATSEPRVEATTTRTRAWNPHVQSWSARQAECPAFFSREIEGFGVFKLGPTCDPEEVPYAL